MANSAYAQIFVRGKKPDVEAFIDALNWGTNEKPRPDEWMSGVYSPFISDDGILDEGNGEASWKAYGDLRWSLASSLRKEWDEDGHLTLEQFSKKHRLAVEVYTEEVGFEFQEHFIVNAAGVVIVDECIDYYNDWVEELTEEELNDLFLERSEQFEREFGPEDVAEGYLVCGGYEEWTVTI